MCSGSALQFMNCMCIAGATQMETLKENNITHILSVHDNAAEQFPGVSTCHAPCMREEGLTEAIFGVMCAHVLSMRAGL